MTKCLVGFSFRFLAFFQWKILVKFEFTYYLYGDQSSALEIDRHKYTMFRERLLSLNVTFGVNNRKIVCLLPRDYTPYVFYGLW